MRNRWIILMVGLLACGLLAAGCGGDDSSTTPAATTEATTTSEDTSSTEATTSEDTSTTEDSTSADTSGGTTPDDVYQACLDAISGTAAEDAAKPSCDQAKAAFEQCAQQAASAGGDAGDTATAICQSAADEAIKQLQAAGSAG
jgi:cytoskeletal protein RodZ